MPGKLAVDAPPGSILQEIDCAHDRLSHTQLVYVHININVASYELDTPAISVQNYAGPAFIQFPADDGPLMRGCVPQYSPAIKHTGPRLGAGMLKSGDTAGLFALVSRILLIGSEDLPCVDPIGIPDTVAPDQVIHCYTII